MRTAPTSIMPTGPWPGFNLRGVPSPWVPVTQAAQHPLVSVPASPLTWPHLLAEHLRTGCQLPGPRKASHPGLGGMTMPPSQGG